MIDNSKILEKPRYYYLFCVSYKSDNNYNALVYKFVPKYIAGSFSKLLLLKIVTDNYIRIKALYD